MSQSNQPRRSRVRVSSRGQRRLGYIAAIGAIFLVLIIVASTFEAQPAPVTPVAEMPAAVAATASPEPATATPQPQLAIPDTDLYIVSENMAPMLNVATLRSGRLTTVGTLNNVYAVALDRSGELFFTASPDGIRAHGRAQLEERWLRGFIPIAGATGSPRMFALAVSPNEDLLAVVAIYVDETYTDYFAWLQILELDSGTWRAPIALDALIMDYATPPQFLDAQTLLIPAMNQVWVVDLASAVPTRIAKTEHIALDAVAAAWAGPNGPLLVSAGGCLQTLADPLQPVEHCPVGSSVVRNIAPAPTGDLLAMVQRDQIRTEVRDGRLSADFGRNLLIVQSGLPGDPVGTIPFEAIGQGWAWHPNGALILGLGANSLVAWDARSDTLSQPYSYLDAGILGIARSLLTAPPLERAQPIATPAPFAAPPTPVPFATQPTPRPDEVRYGVGDVPVAWVHQRVSDQPERAVIAYAPDGSRTLVLSDVVTTLPRPELPPLLLAATQFDRWALVDTVLSRTVPLSIAIPLTPAFESAPGKLQALLSPDGAQLALLTNRDPLPDDAITASTQLLIIDTATGAARVAADSTTTPDLRYAQLVAWQEDGLHTLIGLPAEGMNNQLYLRLIVIDPQAANRIATVLWEDVGKGSFVTYEPRARLLVNEQLPNDPFSSPLILNNLATGERTTLAQGPFVGIGAVAIAPDGSAVAFAQALPEDPFGARQLIRYDLATGETTRLAEGHIAYITSPITWSADSSRIAWVRSDDLRGSPMPVPIRQVIDATTGAVLEADMPFASDPPGAAVLLLHSSWSALSFIADGAGNAFRLPISYFSAERGATVYTSGDIVYMP